MMASEENAPIDVGLKGFITYIHFVPNLPFFMQEFIFSKNKKGVDHFP